MPAVRSLQKVFVPSPQRRALPPVCTACRGYHRRVSANCKTSGFRDNYVSLFEKEDALYLQGVAYADTKEIEVKDAFRDQRTRHVFL